MRKVLGVVLVCCLVLLAVCNAAHIPEVDAPVERVRRDTFSSRFVSLLCGALCADGNKCFASFCDLGTYTYGQRHVISNNVAF